MYRTITKQLGASFMIRAVELFLLFVIFVALTRVLIPSEYGIFSILNVTISLTMGILVFGIDRFIVRKLSGKSEEQIITSTGMILRFHLILLAVIFIPLFIFHGYILDFFNFKYQTEFQFMLITAFIGILIMILNRGAVNARKKLVRMQLNQTLIHSAWAIPIVITVLLLSRSS